MEANKRIVRGFVNTGNSSVFQGKGFVYINCPNCNKRLIQARASIKTKAYAVDKQHPADSAEMTIKCDRCKSIVAIAK